MVDGIESEHTVQMLRSKRKIPSSRPYYFETSYAMSCEVVPYLLEHSLGRVHAIEMVGLATQVLKQHQVIASGTTTNISDADAGNPTQVLHNMPNRLQVGCPQVSVHWRNFREMIVYAVNGHTSGTPWVSYILSIR